jgi:hypothetical protein
VCLADARLDYSDGCSRLAHGGSERIRRLIVAEQDRQAAEHGTAECVNPRHVYQPCANLATRGAGTAKFRRGRYGAFSVVAREKLAGRQGFEPWERVSAHSLSRRARSTTPAPTPVRWLAERVGFEPTGLITRLFSRQLPSTARPPLHASVVVAVCRTAGEIARDK